MRRLFIFILLLSLCSEIYGQTFFNGSFENNSVTNCSIDIDNTAFDSLMLNIKGIGELQTLDIFHDTICPYFSLAQNGNYYVSLENTNDSTKSTAVSFKLTDTLQIGLNYNFCFYDKGLTIGVGPVEIGVSNNDSTFGSLVYTSAPGDTVWTQRLVNFNAPLTGNYITARYKYSSPPYNGILIDNFGMCESAGIDKEFLTEKTFKIFPNPTTKELNIHFLQNNYHLKCYRILNPYGQELFISPYSEKINIEFLPNGFYILEIMTAEESFFTKFFKQ